MVSQLAKHPFEVLHKNLTSGGHENMLAYYFQV